MTTMQNVQSHPYALSADVMAASALLVVSVIFAAMGMTKMPHHEKFTSASHTFALLFAGMAVAVAIAMSSKGAARM